MDEQAQDVYTRPVDKVYKALPGTLREVMERTGYPAGTVMEMIRRLRSDGTVVDCVAGERDEGGWEPSSYLLRAVDTSSRQE